MAYPRTKTAVAVALLAAIPIGLQWNENRKLRRDLSLAAPGVESMVSGKSESRRRGSEPGEEAQAARRNAAAAPSAGRGTETTGMADWQRALHEQDPVRRSQLIAELIAKFDLKTAPAIAEVFFGEGVEGNFETEAALFMRAWAKLDGAQALAYLEEKKQAGSGSPAMLAALGGWASNNPEAARAWAEAVENGRVREDLLYGVIDGWSLVDFQAAADYAETRPRSEARTRFIELLYQRSLAAGGLAGAQNWFAGISDNDHNKVYRRRAFERIANTMLQRDPSMAAQWIASQASGDFVSQGIIQSTAQKLAETSPENALHWISSMSDLGAEASAAGLGSVVSQWAGKEPEAAGNWLSAHWDHRDYDRMARAYSAAVAGVDGEGALEWARSIQDEGQREAAVVEVARQRIKSEGEGAIQTLRLAGLSDEQLTQAQQVIRGWSFVGAGGANKGNGLVFNIGMGGGTSQVELVAAEQSGQALTGLDVAALSLNLAIGGAEDAGVSSLTLQTDEGEPATPLDPSESIGK